MKSGVPTCRTEGKWVGVADSIPEIGAVWNPANGFGVVEWLNAETPFATGGDSGFLVKYKVAGKAIPLGIHRGSVGSLSFFTFEGDIGEELENALDCNLFFCA
jgi:hypothetical protein